MATFARGSRVTLELPPQVQVIDDVRSIAPSQADQLPASGIGDALGGAEEWELLDSFELRVADDNVAGTNPESKDATAISISRALIDLASDHDAAILTLDEEGIYRWLKQGDLLGNQRVFDLAVDQRAAQGIAKSWKSIRTWVFHFLIEKSVQTAVAVQESFIREGLVVVRGSDAKMWRPVAAPILPRKPGVPVRVLLLVHGIFATTAMTFTALTKDSAGGFLAAAWSEYDAVLGFDHRTLSLDPYSNAIALADALSELSEREIKVDVIAHSRGSLVTRSLVEQVLPSAGRIQVGKVVMAGGPNAGTEIAEVDNWGRFIDLVTNLIVSLGEQFDIDVPERLSALFATIVKAVVREGIEGDHVPGLAALAPTSDFLEKLNTGSDVPADMYYAVVTDFEPSEIVPVPGWALRLLLVAADLGTDELLGVRNDLAVDVTSMASIDGAGLGEGQVLVVPSALGTHHLSYFCARPVMEWIAESLDIAR